MRADLLLFSGDLIDLSLTDLPRACAAMRRLQPQARLFLCEGNHDLIDDEDGFRDGVRDEGLTLLRDGDAIVEVRGVPVQLLGTRWARGAGGRREAAALIEPRRDPQAFPILLAHHPHVFDAAPEFPLVLSGHTHGGMLMLNERLGAGPVLYRYWSGPYRVEDRSVVVSNGAGNWFPLRTHSPAEVGRIVLRA
jgi:predicted MPP superfamily phosphohydrolase